MSENLNIGNRIDGTSNQTDNGIIEKYCYGNNEFNCDVYGGLYQWAEMVQYLNGATNSSNWNPVPAGSIQGICPPGWTIPSLDQWGILVFYVQTNGFPDTEGTALKASYGWNAGGWGTDNFEFEALPTGYRLNNGNFTNLGNVGYYSSYSTFSTMNTFSFLLSYLREDSWILQSSRESGYAVRCLRN